MQSHFSVGLSCWLVCHYKAFSEVAHIKAPGFKRVMFLTHFLIQLVRMTHCLPLGWEEILNLKIRLLAAAAPSKLTPRRTPPPPLHPLVVWAHSSLGDGSSVLSRVVCTCAAPSILLVTLPHHNAVSIFLFIYSHNWRCLYRSTGAIENVAGKAFASLKSTMLCSLVVVG